MGDGTVIVENHHGAACILPDAPGYSRMVLRPGPNVVPVDYLQMVADNPGVQIMFEGGMLSRPALDLDAMTVPDLDLLVEPIDLDDLSRDELKALIDERGLDVSKRLSLRRMRQRVRALLMDEAEA